jgi:hypothetical protein
MPSFMMIDVSDIVLCPEFAQEVDVERNSGGGRDNFGRSLPGSNSTIQIDGSIQPVTEEEKKQFEQGELTEEMIKFLSVDPLYASRDGAEADRIIWHGKKYKVLKSKNWTDHGFYRTFAAFEELV